MQNFDYIIAGGGLAGVTLAHQLLRYNKNFILFDEGKNLTSQVAPGLFNPITGRKMVKTWKANEIFPYLIDFYKKTEALVESEFLYEKTIYRPFLSAEEQNDWIGKSSDPAFNKFIKAVKTKSQYDGRFNDPFGGIELNYSGWLNIPQYLKSSFRYFENTGTCKIVRERFELSDLIVEEDEVTYKGVKGHKIIFCEGVELKNNHYFNWLPLQLLKGEILEVELPFESSVIFNRGIFILPVEKIYKVGATYVHKNVSLSTTDEARQILENKLRGLVQTDYKVVGQRVGIRPTTKDRRPFLGKHPSNNTLYIFNGLGTKGVSLSPYFANHFVEYLEEGKDLMKDININRFS